MTILHFRKHEPQAERAPAAAPQPVPVARTHATDTACIIPSEAREAFATARALIARLDSTFAGPSTRTDRLDQAATQLLCAAKILTGIAERLS